MIPLFLSMLLAVPLLGNPLDLQEKRAANGVGSTVFGGVDLLSGSGGTVPADSLNDKDVIGIYFSAQWANQDRMFTPILADYYKNYDGSDTKFEIVFVSLDMSETTFRQYFDEMPWLALPFNRAKTYQLMSKFNVRATSTLVLVNNKGEVIRTDGRDIVSANLELQSFL